MIWRQAFLAIIVAATAASVAGGCARESADVLFSRGEAATHRVATYGEAETHLEAFLRHYPNDPRADVALQALARILQSQGRAQEAVERYEELVKRFPESRYVDQAQFMIGYIHDQNGRLELARLAYQKVISQYPQSELVDDAKVSIANLGKSLESWLLPDSSGVDTARAGL